MQLRNATSWILGLFGAGALLGTGCTSAPSGATGWNYNDPANGGFENHAYGDQETGPGLVFVEGGTYTMGQVDDDVNFAWDNIPRRVTVSSFYMDATEVTNAYYREYLYWLERIHGADNPELVARATPDENSWRKKLGYNENYVKYYFRHPSYQDYPVVGVSWLQANDYCKWRTDRVNEQILVREGLMAHAPDAQSAASYFTTDGYFNGKFESGTEEGKVRSFNPNEEVRSIRLEDGLLLPEYRLPTEAEWEFAALGLIGNSYQELVAERRTYPWDGHFTREDNSRSAYYGQMQANFMRGNGDLMGVAGSLNDNGDITVPVQTYAPNDYGLYNMAGNVSEWVMDVYRPLSTMDNEEFRPFRGNVFTTKQVAADGTVADVYASTEYDLKLVKTELTAYQDKGAKTFTAGESKVIEDALRAIETTEGQLRNKQFDAAWEEMDLFLEGLLDIDEPDVQNVAEVRGFFSRNVTARPGEVRYREVRLEENLNRDNYRTADNIGYRDGDFESSIEYEGTFTASEEETEGNDEAPMYGYGKSTLINDRTRVYKGGGWDDRAYYLIPGTRRYLDESKSSASIGFRCAMDRLGPPVQLSGY